ncbi:MAG: oligosaccharide flippase family protein [Bacteroidales bacterium]|jgi:O-antigen/teichoic acid export membrane protein|nr:oligosaccharide flippase family protein [Bacteroidales bacterium]
MNKIKQLANQTAVYGISSILGRIINYLLVPLYTRVFLPHEAAVYVELYAYMAMLAIILTYGMETAFFRYSEKSDKPNEVYSTALYSIIISTTLFLLITLLSRNAIAHVLGYDGKTEYIVYFLMILGLDAICAIPFARLRAQQKAWTFALIRLANIGVNVVSNLVLILLLPWLYSTYQIEWLGNITGIKPEVSAIFISNLLASAATVVLLMPTIAGARPRLNIRLWKKMFRYAWPLVIFGLAGVVNETIDRILLKYLLPPDTAMHDLGIYGMCFKISVFIVIFIQAFRYAAEPFFFKEAKEKNAPETYAMVMNYFIIVCFLMFTGIMLFMDVFKYFVGEKYYAGLVIVPLLLLGHIFLGIFYNLSVWYKITEMTRYGAWFSIIGTVVVLSLNFLLIPRLGYMGSAWANFSCYLIMMVLSWAYGQKYYPIPYRLNKFFLYLLISIVLWLAGTYLTPSTLLLRLSINTLLFIGFALFILYKEPELMNFVRKKLTNT